MMVQVDTEHILSAVIIFLLTSGIVYIFKLNSTIMELRQDLKYFREENARLNKVYHELLNEVRDLRDAIKKFEGKFGGLN